MMNTKFKFVLKKLVCNKVRNIYIKVNSKSKKQYLKYKGDMIHITVFKNLKKKIKKKGGEGNGDLIEKIRDYINEINDNDDILDGTHSTKLLDIFKEHYTKSNNIRVNNNYDFLVNLLEYLKNNYHKRNYEDEKKLYQALILVLDTIEQEGITGVYYPVEDEDVNPNDYKLSKNDFEIVERLISNFTNNDKQYYIEKYFKYGNIGITISNTQLKNFINRIQCNDELAKWCRPKSALDNRPKSALDNRPKSALDNRPKSALHNRPKSALHNRPKSALHNRPKSASYERPGSALNKRPRSASQEGPRSTSQEGPRSRSPKRRQVQNRKK